MTMPTDAEMTAFKRGEEAFTRGAERDSNPYPENSRLFDMWSFGWIAGEQDKGLADWVEQQKTLAPTRITRGSKNERPKLD